MFEFYFETSGSASYWTIRNDISATQYSWAKLLHVQVNLLDGLQKLFLQKDHLRGGMQYTHHTLASLVIFGISGNLLNWNPWGYWH